MPIPYFSRWASVNFSSFTNTIKSLTIKLKIFTDSAFSFWGTMPEKKHKIRNTSINNQFKANVSPQKSVVALKRIIKSIIIYKNQWNETRNLFLVLQ